VELVVRLTDYKGGQLHSPLERNAAWWVYVEWNGGESGEFGLKSFPSAKFIMGYLILRLLIRAQAVSLKTHAKAGALLRSLFACFVCVHLCRILSSRQIALKFN
jgi:hypothetical protein